MIEMMLPMTRILYHLSDHQAAEIDVVEVSWMIDDWMEELAEEKDLDRDRKIAKRLADYLNQQPQTGEVRYKFTRTDAVSFLLGLSNDVERLKKKLSDRQSLSPSTDPTSSPTAPANCHFSGSFETKSSPTENLPHANAAPSSPENA